MQQVYVETFVCNTHTLHIILVTTQIELQEHKTILNEYCIGISI